ncbi:transporter substrate-binding domain-containing protein [Pseudodesulfovibrio sp.]|nr:transporter substrate-binding domain-containing protein [Pseudodesulfovibrio sp.]
MKRSLMVVTVFFVISLFAFISASRATSPLFDPYREKGITIAQESDMAPMSFKGADGSPRGYIIDLWYKWSAETGIPIRFYLVDWADTLTAVRDGKADVHGGLFFTNERDKYLDYTLPFFPSKGGLFVRHDSNISSFDELKGQRVGVIEKSFYDNYTQRTFPDIVPVRSKTATELVNATARGDIEVFLADYPTLMYQIGIMGKIDDFKVVEFVSEQQFRAAVAEGNLEMLTVIEKGLSLIDQSERDSILNRWIIGDDVHPRGWLLPVVLISLFSLLLALVVPFVFSKLRP